MSTALDEFEKATLATAVLRGWLIGLLTGVGVFALSIFGIFVMEVIRLSDEWASLITALPALAMVSFFVAVLGGIIALPSGGIFWAMLLIAERVSLRFRTLPVWLAAGLAAATPAAAIVWHLCFTTFADSDSIASPFAWENIRLPLLTLFCGLVGAFFAWRARQRELAE